MDTSLHDLRAGLAAAIAGLEAFIDGETEPAAGEIHGVVVSLGTLDERLGDLLGGRRDKGVTVGADLFHAIVEAAPTAMLLIDERGAIALVNLQAEKLFGYSRMELIGQQVELLVPERFHRSHRGLRGAFNHATIARPMGVGRDLCGRRKDGAEIPLEVALNPVATEGAGFTLAVMVDISERKRAEQLRIMNAAARQRAAELEAERQRECSTAFQRAVLPVKLPHVPGCAFDAVYEPGLADAQVGGDWYDAVHLIDGRVLISIGDVSGSGLESAVVVGVARQVMRGIAQLHADPMLILDAADRALCLEYPGIYVSAWVGLLDLVTRTITYASAGHPPPLLVERDGSVRELDDPCSMLIGLREGVHGQASTVAFAQGDTLVLYTDGVTEASRDLIAGITALHAAAAAVAPAPGPHPADAIRQRVIPDGSFDDVALLVVGTDCDEAERHIERWQFDVRDAAGAGAVRRRFVASLEAHGFSADDRDTAELVLGELIGNVVRHAAHIHAVEAVVDHGGDYSVLHIIDRGSGFYHNGRLPADPYAEGGRGLFLVGALTIAFTVSERCGGGSHARVVLRGGSRTARMRPTLLRPRTSV
jgi:PAS domain S-box-containing protein